VADMPEAPSPGGGGFSLSKRYGPLPAWAWGLLGGASVFAAWKFYQSRHGASSAATSGSDQSTGVDFAPQIATLQAEIEQLQQGEGGEGKSSPSPPGTRLPIPDPGPPGGGSKPTTNTKVMPNVVGQRANFAIGELKSGYGIRATTVPVRNPRNEYSVTSQTPKAGARVSAGTPAVLRVKVVKKGKAA